jgi:hypothetical protein
MKFIYFLLYAASLLIPSGESVKTTYAALAVSPVTGSKSSIHDKDEVPELKEEVTNKAAVKKPAKENCSESIVAADDFVSAKYNLPRVLVIE